MPNRFIVLVFILFLGNQLVFGQSGTLSGTITDSKTGETLLGATVILEGTTIGSATNSEGRYLIRNIPPKTYNIRASYIGYESLTRFNIVIRSEGNIDINFELNPENTELDEVVVTPNPFIKESTTPLSIQKLNQEEITAYPGGNNDIAKVVQTLPGVSGSVGGFRNDVIIRGGAPNENVYYLDGIEIPNINHFATQGSAGGPVGLLNVSFFEGVTLTASSFDAKYDNVLSGVLQFDQRNGNAREFQGNFRLGSSESALTLEGPLFKGDKQESNTTVIASVRRSYLQFLFGIIGLPILPNYWDYQYKLNHKIDSNNEILITGLGSIDTYEVNELDEFDPEQQAIQDQVPIIKQETNTVGVSWRHRFNDSKNLLQTTLSNNLLNNRFFRYEDNVNEEGLYFKNDSREMETKLRSKITLFQENWTYNAGIVIQNANYSNNTTDLLNSNAFNSSINFFRYGLFGQSSGALLNNKLNFSFGFRFDGNTFTDSGNEFYKTFSPRVSASYTLSENGKWTLNASLGRYYKIPPYTILGFQNSSGSFVNKNSDYIRSDHAVAGVEYLINERSRFTIEGFYKWYSDYPSSLRDSVSLANKGGGFEVLGSEPVASSGEGRTYGTEILFQQKFNGQIYGIAAFTFYKSEFSGLDGVFRPSLWDNNVLISLLGGYKLPRNWEISARYRYLGRTPFTPVDLDATLNNYPAEIFDFSRLGDDRLDAYSQLDLRVDKKWSFNKLSIDLFLEIQNILAQENPQVPQYGLNRTESGDVITPRELVQVNLENSANVLPSIGLVVNF
ncbi:MAG: TonB-dependent receptor [Balneolaceae bacterium]